MRYLVTGGAGFIGSHLCEALLSRGDSVVSLDDLSTGHADNHAGIGEHPRFAFEAGSILDAAVVDRLVAGCDVVVHLAAAIGVRLIVDEPLRSMRTNIAGTEHVLDAANRNGVKVFIASTSEVYGKTDERMAETTDRVLGPTTVQRWSYSAAKAIDEHLAFGYHREHGLPVVIGRFFNTVGPRQSGAYGGVLPRFVRQALAGEDLTLYGDGSQTRCFCDVSDVVAAVIGLLDAGAAVGEAYNIGSEQEISMAALADKVIAATGSSSAVTSVAFRDVYGDNYEDIGRRVPDTSKLRALLAWSPAHDLDAIISRTIAAHGART